MLNSLRRHVHYDESVGCCATFVNASDRSFALMCARAYVVRASVADLKHLIRVYV